MGRIESRLIEVIQARAGVTLSLSSTMTELKMDSISIFQLISELEDEFEVRLDQDVLEIETVAELAAYIRARLPESSKHS